MSQSADETAANVAATLISEAAAKLAVAPCSPSALSSLAS